MVIFDQLRISDDGQRLYINAHVNGADYFENIYLQSITIMTQDKVTEATDAGEITKDYIYKKVLGENVKSLDLVIDKGVLDAAYTHMSTDGSTADTAFTGDFSRGLFFVFIKVQGEPDECTPCSLDKEVTVGVTFDTASMYQKVMGFTRELADGCEIPKNFIDFIMNFNALKAAIDTEHFVPAIGFYNQLMEGRSTGVSGTTNSVFQSKPCGCRS